MLCGSAMRLAPFLLLQRGTHLPLFADGQNAGQRPEILKGWRTRSIPSTPPHIEAPDVPAAGTLGTGRTIFLLKKTLGRPVWETLLRAAPGIAITFRLGKAEP